MKTNYDVVVIGAGPAGAIASSRILQAGMSVLVIEKTSFPRFVIGESLLPQCMNYLEKADLLECVEDLKAQVKTGVIFYHENERCDFLFKERFSEGWDYTYQVKRAEFDHALIQEVEKKGAEVTFNSEVINVKTSKEEQVVFFNDANGKEHKIDCRFVIDASGYGRVLPRLFDLEIPSDLKSRGAIFTHLIDDKRTSQAAENIFVNAFNNNTAWVWSIPFSDGTSSVGVVGDDAFIQEISENNGEKFTQIIRTFPGLNDRYAESKFIFDPKTILGYSIGIKQLHGDGFVLCGNSTEFLDPIFSSGVMFALASGYEAADLVVKELNGEKVDWKKEYDTFLMHGVAVFRSYVDAWYNGDLHTIIFEENSQQEFKEQICSVLAGYVWDMENPFVKKHKTLLRTLAKVISIRQS